MRQKGYTMLELLVVIPIGAAIVAAFSLAFFQIMESRETVTNRSIALADIDNAIHWIAQDLVMAQEVSLQDGGPPTNSLTASWSDYTHWAADEGIVDYNVVYQLSGTKLLRNYTTNTTSQFIVGRYITYVGFSFADRVFTVTLVSQPGQAESAVNKTFVSEMRTDLLPLGE